jgi:hypothetical protein
MSTTSYEIEKGLYLVRQVTNNSAPTAKTVETPTNHIAVIDCSGSMAYDLPRIREQLKKKLPKLLREGDTLSIIWFSGKGQYGALLEGEPIATLKDLGDVNKQLDRWLRPVGLTGFKEPLQQVEATMQEVSKKNKNPFALFFMSDGCDNQWPREDILRVVGVVTGGTNSTPCISSSTFVEYGYYADRPLLAAMAAKAGGVHIHADAFDKFDPVFETALQKHPVASKRIEVAVGGDPIGGFAYALADFEITTFEASTGKVVVPEQTTEIWYLSPSKVGDAAPPVSSQSRRGVFGDDATPAAAAVYAAMSLYAVRMKPEIVYPILKATGDVRFINMFSACFGKQKYSEFMDSAKLAAFSEKSRWQDGYDPNKVPPDDAFTVLDLLRTLADDEHTRVMLSHPEFKYSRIGRGRLDADENLTADEQEQLEVIREKMSGEKNAVKLKALQVEIDTILASKRDALKFVADEAPTGYPIANLTYNECSPNISVLVKKTGIVDLVSRPDHAKYTIPAAFKTHIWRNYAIVSHGLVNVEKLPVNITEATYEKLKEAGVEMNPPISGFGTTVINVKPLPIINRKMVKAVSAKTIIELEWELLKARAAQKVYKAYQDELFPGVKLKGYIDLYTADGAVWLKDQGLTNNGFSPKSTQADSKDFIMGKELEIKLKGCSKLDSVKAVREKITAKKKLNPCDTFMSNAITEVDDFIKKNPKNLHEKWLTGQTQAQIAKTRGLIYQTAQIKFSVIVGQVWFTEFKSLDENTLTLKLDGQDVTGICEMREVEIKV